ncbi:PREDICTED: osteoclast-associated immunoglobulin-like receptor-like, partial [Lipotes vexillifer]|uniref:Osteoclast-associated immunoglobulin-like receptor-like n=1 Tax=Lipotes vexillifer TaxID=118797 RepID=A0A340Y9D3_LIPVE
VQVPGPSPSDPGAQGPSPSPLRPALLPQTQGSGSPAPPPSDPGVQAPSPFSLRPRGPSCL